MEGIATKAAFKSVLPQKSLDKLFSELGSVKDECYSCNIFKDRKTFFQKTLLKGLSKNLSGPFLASFAKAHSAHSMFTVDESLKPRQRFVAATALYVKKSVHFKSIMGGDETSDDNLSDGLCFLFSFAKQDDFLCSQKDQVSVIIAVYRRCGFLAVLFAPMNNVTLKKSSIEKALTCIEYSSG